MMMIGRGISGADIEPRTCAHTNGLCIAKKERARWLRFALSEARESHERYFVIVVEERGESGVIALGKGHVAFRNHRRWCPFILQGRVSDVFLTRAQRFFFFGYLHYRLQ